MKTARFLNIVAVLAAASGNALAADIYLCAGQTTMTLPGNVQVPVWGFSRQASADQLGPGCGAGAQLPGPELKLEPTDTALTIHLYNDGLPEPVSVVIPGQHKSFAPVFFTDGQGRRRVRSFDNETAPGAVGTYVWNNLAPGTYVYHSGSHPQVQVQMGLYGGLTKDAAPGEAYAGVPYDTELTLLFSEIDPALHQAVADGSYGSASYPSTVDYRPRYFLVNGAPFTEPAAFLTAGSAGGRTLIRFLNMGLKTHVPVLQGADMKIVAEDGNPYSYPKRQYSVMLAAAKTKDAIFSAPANGIYPLYDRMLNLSNAGASPGGMFQFLEVGSQAGAPQAVDDHYLMDEDAGPLNVAAPGVLGNDVSSGGALTVSLADNVGSGDLTLNPDGSFVFNPLPDANGNAVFTYRAVDGSVESNLGTVTITIAPVNDAPVATGDDYALAAGTTLGVPAPGVLGNDTDVDGDVLSAVLVSSAGNGAVTLQTDGSFTYTPAPGYTGSDSFSYQASDGTVASAPVSVSLTVNAAVNQAPEAVDDYAATAARTPVSINVVANDIDADGTVDAASVVIVTPPRNGTAASNGDGTVTYTPRPGFKGSDAFGYTVNDTLGATSNEGIVRVDVTR